MLETKKWTITPSDSRISLVGMNLVWCGRGEVFAHQPVCQGMHDVAGAAISPIKKTKESTCAPAVVGNEPRQFAVETPFELSL